MQDTKAITIPYPYYKNVLVARNGQPDETIYKDLHALPPIRGWFPQGPFMPHCGYYSPGSPSCWFHKHQDHTGAKQIT